MADPNLPMARPQQSSWNKACIVDQERQPHPKYVRAIRVRLKFAEPVRDLAMFNMAVDEPSCATVALQS